MHVCMYNYIYIYLFFCLCVCLFARVFVCVSVVACLFVCVFLFLCWLGSLCWRVFDPLLLIVICLFWSDISLSARLRGCFLV